MVEPEHATLSIRRQCQLLGLSRATYYYTPAQESAENLALMRLIDAQYLKTPFYGYPRMTVYLRDAGYRVNPKRIARLMQVMGLQALMPRPRTTRAEPGHKIYPYLLRGLSIERSNQVWSTDITYVPMQHGFMYLVAIMDWYSRYVLAWELSNTLDGQFCVEVLDQALTCGTPEIFNTDQGVQYTAEAFTGRLEAAGVAVSMDGRGRWMDNVFVERLWRTVKYEYLYLHDHATPRALQAGLADYFPDYNEERIHAALDYQTPMAVYLAT
jgi:putative transposase